jgi:histidinol dehydrogenase
VRLLSFNDRTFASQLRAFADAASASTAVSASVAAILADVRRRGDAAVAAYAAKFDRARLTPRQFRVSEAELKSAVTRLPAADRRAIRAALAAVLAFNRRSLPKGWTARNPHGARVGERHFPLQRVGIYVPGGQVPLVSTVLMTVTLAKIAGCPEIAAFTPSNAEGKVSEHLLAALALAGVKEVYRIGGVQAVGAMAYGTATIRPVDKVFGPGNAYVCEAKRQVFGTVGVDSLPGPSEVMVIADDSAVPRYAAADLLAQAEHGSGREKIYLVATSRRVVARIAAEVERQLKTLPRADRIRPVLKDGFLTVVVRSLDDAVTVANHVAPEHLELLVRPAAQARLTRAITTAGAIMLGNFTPTAVGDFAAGPSHVLPTGGAGRFLSGLRVADFMRRTSLLAYDRRSLSKAAPVVAAFAAMEQLAAHGRSVSIRVG